MDHLGNLLLFLEKLEDRKIFYQLNKVRDSILVEVTIPGQRWEVEFMLDGSIEIEKFISTATIFPESELDVLFQEYSD